MIVAHPTTVLAFDLGASSGRALVGELQESADGQSSLHITEVHRFPNYAVQMGGHLHWDFPRILQEVKTGIRKAFQAGFKPVSFGIDTWGVDFGLLDRNGELLGEPYHYRNSQTDGLIEEIGVMAGPGRLYRESGIQFMPFNTIYQLYAMKKAKSPKLELAETLLLTPDLITYFLTGEKVCEYTMATTTGLFDPTKQDWNRPLMEELGIPPHIFLDPIRPGTKVGKLSQAVSDELGVPAIQAVAVGTHDTQSAVAAVPAQSGAFAFLVSGTWSLLGTEQGKPALQPEAMENNFSNEGGAAGTFDLLKNIMGLWLLQECRREWEEKGKAWTFPELVAMAEKAPAFRSFIHPDDLRFIHPGGMRDKIRGYCSETGQPVPETEGEIVRCILESLAMQYRVVLEETEKLAGASFAGLHAVGGGIQNELLSQFTANALGRPVWAGPVEASAIGNMLMQFYALGRFKGLEEARDTVRRSFPMRTFEPQGREMWEDAFKRFCEVTGQ